MVPKQSFETWLAGMSEKEMSIALGNWFDISRSGTVQEVEGRRWRLIYTQFSASSLPPGPKIVVASSGNCLGGPVIEHLANHLLNPQATVAFAGYIPSISPGYTLKLLAGPLTAEEREGLKLKLGEQEFNGADVAAAVEGLSPYYSGHADESGLVDFILRRDTNKPTPPLRVFLNHGDRRSRTALKEWLEGMAKAGDGAWRKLEEVFLPEAKDGWFDLVAGRWDRADASVGELSDRLDELEQKLEEVLANQETILNLLKSRPAQ
jgi:Cft2 family RNA processing exonuclease